jgi:hypothetical protein
MMMTVISAVYRCIALCGVEAPRLAPAGNQSPVASIVGMRLESHVYRPSAIESVITLTPLELRFVLMKCCRSTAATWTSFAAANIPRDVTDAILELKESELLQVHLSQTSLDHLLPVQLYLDSSLYFAKASDGAETAEEDLDIPGASELSSLNWIVSASRATLKHIFEDYFNPVKSSATVSEVEALKKSLVSKQPMIVACLEDMRRLALFGDLLATYRAQMQVLVNGIKTDMQTPDSIGTDDHIYAIAKIFSQQVKLDRDLNGRAIVVGSDGSARHKDDADQAHHPTIKRNKLSKTTASPHAMQLAARLRESTNHASGTGLVTSGAGSAQASASISAACKTSNPLWIVMNNVFKKDASTQ